VSLDERPRGSTRPTPKVHYNSLPRTSIDGALGGGHRTIAQIVSWAHIQLFHKVGNFP
jgi:hypothetical protein